MLAVLGLGACASSDVPVPEQPETLVTSADTEPATPVERMVAHYGARLDPPWSDRIRKAFEGGEGVSAATIKQAVASTGLRAFAFQGDDIDGSPTNPMTHLDLGRCVLVLLGEPKDRAAWRLLVGYDRPTRVWIVQRVDGSLGGVPFDRFDSEWNAAGRMTILAGVESRR